MGVTKYQKKWEKDYPWLTSVAKDVHSAYCKICLKSFKIDNSGEGQVKSHRKCHGNEKRKAAAASWEKQRTFTVGRKEIALTKNKSIVLTSEESCVKAEVLQALHMVETNQSFASAKDDGARYRMMFPDSEIAKNYKMADSKAQYVIKFGIAEYLKRHFISDVEKTPYSFLFDETTTMQVKKQYDAYVLFWSKKHGRVIHAYCGSLFVGHCNADNLLEHYQEFVMQLGLDSNYLLHCGMDGPNVNLLFETKLAQHLLEIDSSFLKLGSCSLHPVHSAFQKVIKKLYQGTIELTAETHDKKKKVIHFDLDNFFQDIHFFFKLSSARREDYASLEQITGVTAEYAKKHAETRWVSMKYVALRCLEQWPNLEEYFLTYLPRQKNFKHDIQNTQRYIRIKTALTNPLMEAYVAFCAFVAHDFESFLVPFQTSEPMIHLLHPSLCNLLNKLQIKFIRSKKLSSDLSENIYIDVNNRNNAKPLNKIDVGTRALKMFSAKNVLIPDEKQDKFREDCLNFYVTAVQYLQKNLPFEVKLLQHAQYIHPEKRNAPAAYNAISNLAIKITAVLENCLSVVFRVKEPVTKDSVVDLIRNQWLIYQNEIINKEWYVKQITKDEQCSSRKQSSYWERAEEQCELISNSNPKEQFKRIDEYWSRVERITDDNGAPKYTQLVALIKCLCSLSHGNSIPERGFSINKLMLAVHGYATYEDTIVAIRMVKDELHRVGGAVNFPVTRELLTDAKSSFSRYEADRLVRKEAKEKDLRKKKQDEEDKANKLQGLEDLTSIEDEIASCKASISVANDLIDGAQENLVKALEGTGKNVQRDLTQQALSKLQVGTERKRKFEEDLSKLEKKKKKAMNSIK